MRAASAALASCLALAAPGLASPTTGTGRPPIDYMLQCQGCHLPDGSGKAGEVPSLVGVGRFLRIPGGRAYLARVPGAALSPLGDAELAALLSWMVRRFGPADVAGGLAPYTAAEVAALRRRPLAQVQAVRAALLATLPGSSPRAPAAASARGAGAPGRSAAALQRTADPH